MTLPNMGLTLPTQGIAGAGVWDDALDANATLTDAHDHSPGKGAPVKTNGISINADLTFASLYAPINLHRITFASIVALSSSNKSLFVNAVDSELYWRSNAGTNVKLTSGSALNVAAFVGGIGGDYAATGALVDYDDATDTYRFRQELASAVRQFAKVRLADIQLVEYDPSGDATVPANAVTIKSPDALAGSYTVTLPAAAPGSTLLVQMDSAGTLSASNTVANAVTLSATLTAAAVTASGLVTANAGVTAGANQHVTVSGTGEYKHGARTLLINAAEGQTGTNAGTAPTYTPVTTEGRWSFGTSVLPLNYPIRLIAGDRITGWKAYIQKTSNATGTITARLRKLDPATGTVTTVGSDQTNSANAPGFVSLSLTGLTETAAPGASYFVQLIANGVTGDHSYGCEATVDHP